MTHDRPYVSNAIARERLSRAAVTLAALLAACVSPTPYRPADDSGPGYRDWQIEENRFGITFQGNEVTSRATVEKYLLYRAAELTLQNGYDYFVVVERTTDTEADIDPTWTPVYGHYFYGRRGSGHPRFPYYAQGFPWSRGVAYDVDRRYEATAFVVLREGAPPPDDPDVYDARAVVQNLGPEIVRPGEDVDGRESSRR